MTSPYLMTAHPAMPLTPLAWHRPIIGPCPWPPSSPTKMSSAHTRPSLLPLRRPPHQAPRQRPVVPFHGRRRIQHRELCSCCCHRGAMARPSSTDSASTSTFVANVRSSTAAPRERDPTGGLGSVVFVPPCLASDAADAGPRSRGWP